MGGASGRAVPGRAEVAIDFSALDSKILQSLDVEVAEICADPLRSSTLARLDLSAVPCARPRCRAVQNAGNSGVADGRGNGKRHVPLLWVADRTTVETAHKLLDAAVGRSCGRKTSVSGNKVPETAERGLTDALP